MKKIIILGLILLTGLMLLGCETNEMEETGLGEPYQQEAYSDSDDYVPYIPPAPNVDSLASMCEGYYSAGGMRDACYAMSAIDNNIPELCERMTTETPEKITLCMGEASGEPSYCERLTPGSYEHYKCYSHMAETHNDASYCDNIDEDEAPAWKGACLVPFR